MDGRPEEGDQRAEQDPENCLLREKLEKKLKTRCYAKQGAKQN